jgi:hypothetical protein
MPLSDGKHAPDVQPLLGRRSTCLASYRRFIHGERRNNYFFKLNHYRHSIKQK